MSWVIVKIERETMAGREPVRIMHVGDRVEIGSSMEAGIRDLRLGDRQIKISVGVAGCTVSNLDISNELQVNDEWISEKLLTTNAKLTCKNARYHLSIEIEATEADPSPDEVRCDYRIVKDMLVARGQLPSGGIHSLLQLFVKRHPAFALVNLRRASVDATAFFENVDDLLHSFPDQIRMNDSLHLLEIEHEQLIGSEGSPEYEGPASLFLELARQDALIVCLPLLKATEWLANNRVYLGWFRTPSVLKFFLDNPSTDLSHDLMRDLNAVLMFDSNTQDWFAYSRNDAEFDLHSVLGVAAPS